MDARAWVLQNCKFAAYPYPPEWEPTVEDVNTREPGIKDATIDWDYYGRDSEGEKIYYPMITIHYVDQEGKFTQHSVFGRSMEEANHQYNEWASKMGFVPKPATEKDYYNPSFADWDKERQQDEQAKQDIVRDREEAEQMKQLERPRGPAPTGKMPWRL